MTNTIDYALMAGASYRSNRPQINRLPIPTEYSWGEIAGSYGNLSDTSGFEAVSFVKGSEIVITFAGNNFSSRRADSFAVRRMKTMD